jgi:hypothetical protein
VSSSMCIGVLGYFIHIPNLHMMEGRPPPHIPQVQIPPPQPTDIAKIAKNQSLSVAGSNHLQPIAVLKTAKVFYRPVSYPWRPVPTHSDLDNSRAFGGFAPIMGVASTRGDARKQPFHTPPFGHHPPLLSWLKVPRRTL